MSKLYLVTFRSDKHDGPPPIAHASFKQAKKTCIDLLSVMGDPYRLNRYTWQVDSHNDRHFAYIEIIEEPET